ncbi:MAG: IS200/IS605 family transposase [Prevotella sp.]|nr:IS200/IS605 family transposase [Prevotella sp.]MCD8289511.1 IS200/IS605 family transposase [Prevotella sp.]
MSFRKLTYHAVFPTHARQHTINPEHDQDLYAYIAGIIKNQGGFLHAIGGMPDHIHILLDIPATITVADCIKDIKQYSSAWLHENRDFPMWDGWGAGYSVFTCSAFETDGVVKYVNGQKEHHSKKSFAEELKEILDMAHISYDENYLP